MEGHERLLTTKEVATLFRVDEKTVRRWHYAGRLPTVSYPGRHLRYRESDVRALLDGRPGASPAPPLWCRAGPANG